MDWLDYSPADLVPFSQDAWRALIADYNRAHWPWVLAGVAMGLLLLGLTAGATRWRLRAALALLALCWLWIGWAFVHQALGRLLWAADWLAWGFAAQGALLLAVAGLGGVAPQAQRRGSAAPAWWLLAFAVLGLPLLAFAAGRPWPALGGFGTTPDATAIGTLAVAAMLAGPSAWLLRLLPMLWCLLSTAMLQVLDEPLWPLPLLAVGFAAVLSWRRRRTTARG